MNFDVLIVSDFRFPGGTSTSIVSEIEALTEAGYSVGLLSVSSNLLSPWRMMHAGIMALVDNDSVAIVPPGQPVDVRLCCLHHPVVFENYPSVPLLINAEQTLLIVHHPPVDNVGDPQFDLEKVSRVCREIFGSIEWAPVGPKVRKAFDGLDNIPILAKDDWVNVIDVKKFRSHRTDFTSAIPVLGRHSRPDPIKWPEARNQFLSAYPDDPEIRVRLMGYDGTNLKGIVRTRPDNWELLKFGAMPVPDFLTTLDYFSYFHSDNWIEAFGRSILEAMSSGLVCFLPEHFRPEFGDGAVYCLPRDVATNVMEFHSNSEAYALQSERAINFVRDNYGLDKAVERVRARIGEPNKSLLKAPQLSPAGKSKVVYLTSNGIGMGHLTRCMASGRRLMEDVEPVIVTMSKAFGAVRDQGITVEYLPYFRSVGLDPEIWQSNLTEELSEIFKFYQAKVFVFDGNVPYQGVLNALAARPEMWKIWQRRGMWRPGTGENSIACETHFDAIVEPGEIAAAMDRGLTTDHRGKTVSVPPVRMLRDNEALPREAARAVMGLKSDKPAVFIQLGSGNNFRTDDLASFVFDQIKRMDPNHEVQIVVGSWRISNDPVELPEGVIELTSYPFARFLNAFDYAIAMAGYNTFHENIAAGLPTLFLSNENPEQDEQWLRAEYGAIAGVCLASRPFDYYSVARNITNISDKKTQQKLRQKCRALPAVNGAGVVAKYLSQLALTRKPHAIAK